jgi:flagellar basal-body rod modification protein FlgD
MNAIDTDLLSNLGLTARDASSEKKDDRLGQADFLKLMTMQLQNQDPFKPMESGEFLGQLAQFATVSGIEDLQRSFRDLSASIHSGQALQAANLVGREAIVPGDLFMLDPAEGQRAAADLPFSSSEVAVGVYDQSGALVRQLFLGPRNAGLIDFHWDGRNESGALMAPGIYEFRAETRDPGASKALGVYLSAPVESVVFGSPEGSLTLQVGGVGEVDFSDVRGIR